MPIPLLDLKLQYATIRDEVMKVTSEIYESQYFILGPRVAEFEKDFAAYCHSKHSVGVSSGTDALLEALMVLDVGAGDEVIVPAYSFFATAGVVHRLGAKPVFADIDLVSYNIDPASVEKLITPKTKAIIPVHLYGQAADMDALMAISKRHNIPVIEDAAQAVGAEFDGKRVGSIGTLGCFSFFPSKNLGAFGDAGAITTNDDAMYERLVDFRVHGMRPKYYHKFVGGNFRIDALQAAILHVKMNHLEAWTEGRRRNAAIYGELFGAARVADAIVLPTELPRRRHVFNQYILRFTGGQAVRDRVLQALRDAQIGCDIYYPLTLPAQECFKEIACPPESVPNSELAAAQTLAIPVFPELTHAQMAEVVSTITNALP